jgi:hypothetical protein
MPAATAAAGVVGVVVDGGPSRRVALTAAGEEWQCRMKQVASRTSTCVLIH